MIDGIISGAATMDSAAARLDASATNLANAQTPGYKRLLPVLHSFAAVLSDRLGGTELAQASTARDGSAGIPKATGNPFDVMLRGEGWLSVDTPRGARYTRAGALALGADGTITTQQGHPILGDGGPIRLQPGGGAPEIDAAGAVRQGETTVGTLRVVTFSGEFTLEPEGDGLLRLEGAGAEQAADGVEVVQGHLEQSNVDPVVELVDMVKALRLFEAAGNSLKTQDRTLQALMRAV